MITTAALRAALVLAPLATTCWAGADEGKALYQTKCRPCHSVGGEGGKLADKGGPLDGIGGKRDATWLHAYLKDPKSQVPDTKMGKIPLTNPQIDDLVAFLLTLKASAK
jgi:cytochrome c2